MACVLALSLAADKSVNDESAQELSLGEQRYGGYRGGYGRRYGRSVTEVTNELEGEEQRYGGYRGGYGSYGIH